MPPAGRNLAQVDHYVGRLVEGCFEDETAGQPEWTIDLNGARIVIQDPTCKFVDLKGMKFERVFMAAHTTNLVFAGPDGEKTIGVNAALYALEDDNFGGERVWPQRGDPFDPETPPDPSSARTSEGPTIGEEGGFMDDDEVLPYE